MTTLHHLPRRAFLLGSTALSVGACESFGARTDETIRGLVEYGSALYNGVKSAWMQLQYLPQIQALSESTRNTIISSGKAIEDLLSALKAIQGLAQAQPLVAKLTTYATTALGELSKIPGLPETIKVLMAADQIVLPVLQSLVGLAIVTAAQVQAAGEAKTILNAAPTTVLSFSSLNSAPVPSSLPLLGSTTR